MCLLAPLRPSLSPVPPPGPAQPLPELAVPAHPGSALAWIPLLQSQLKKCGGNKEHGAEQGKSLGQGRGICHRNTAGPQAWLQLWGLHTGCTSATQSNQRVLQPGHRQAMRDCPAQPRGAQTTAQSTALSCWGIFLSKEKLL